MVTPNRLLGISRRHLYLGARQAIRLAFARQPDLSQDAILRTIRSEGHRIANAAGRELIRELRIELSRQQATERGDLTLEFRTRLEGSNRFNSFLYNERDLRGLSRERVTDRIRQSIRNKEQFLIEPNRVTRITDFTHVSVDYTATALVTQTIGGRIVNQTTSTTSGTIVTEIGAFTNELVAERIRQQIMGRQNIEFGLTRGLGANSVIDGLQTEVGEISISIDSISPRGSARNRG